MLNYTMSEDGNRAIIDACRGGFVRLSIIRLCRELGIAIPSETLDEETDIEDLRDLNTNLLIRRAEIRKLQNRQEAMRQAEERRERERHLSPEIAAQVAALRERAQAIRHRAQYADDYSVFREEMDAAAHLEQEAARLIA